MTAVADSGVDATAHSHRVLARGLGLIWRTIRMHPVPNIVSILGASMWSLLTVGLTVFLGQLTDDVIVPGLDGDGVSNGDLVEVALVLLAIGLLRGASVTVRRYFMAMAEHRVQRSWRLDILGQYLDQPLSFHRGRPTGELLAHADADITAATSVLKPLAFVASVAVLVIAALVSLLALHPFFFFTAMILFPTLGLLNRIYTARVVEPSARVQAEIGEVSNVAFESFDGVMVVKTLGREEAEVERFSEASDRLRKQRIVVGRLRAVFEPTIDALPNLGVIVLLVLGARLLSTDSITVGDIVTAISLFTMLALPIRIVGFFLEEMPRSVVAFERIEDVLHLEKPADTAGSRTFAPNDTPGAVEFDNVVFSHADQVVLDRLGFVIGAGEVVALVGATGSGKSTIADLIVGLTEPDSGTVKIGGIPLADLHPDEVTNNVGLVFQETFLFGASVRENITLGADVSDADLERVTRLVRAHQFILEMPQGYDTVVGERGVTLSGGQRQRVALARALVRSPSLLFLDDATSAIDPSVEQQILDNLRAELDLTLLVVAHRLSTIRLADRVIFLSGGAILASGKHDELLAVPEYEALARAYELGAD